MPFAEEYLLGQVLIWPVSFVPAGFAKCDGRLLSIAQYPYLWSLLGVKFGGDGMHTFALPDLRGRMPMGDSVQFPLGSSGGLESANLVSAARWVSDGAAASVPPSLGLDFIICINGPFPYQGFAVDKYVGEIIMAAWDITPDGMLNCKGQTVPSNDYPALDSLISGIYAQKSSRSSLMLPDLSGRFPFGTGQPSDSSLTSVSLGKSKSIQDVRIAQAAGTEQRPVTIPAKPPFCALKFMLVTYGTYPSRDSSRDSMRLRGEIFLCAFGFIPDGSLPCDGRLLQIREYPGLYNLLGKKFGGDGAQTFALPDLRGRIPMGVQPSGRLGETATKVSDGSGDLVVSNPPVLGLQFVIDVQSFSYPFEE